MRYLLFITLVVVCFSCSKQKPATFSFKIYHIEEALDMKSETLWLDSICDSITIIPLETSDEILMNGFGFYYLYNNLLFIVHGGLNQNDRLSVFDLSGNYLWDIGRRGRGPGEYISINQPNRVFFNDNKLYLYDWSTYSILCYTLDGKFIKKIMLPNNHIFRQFTFINKDVFAGFVGVGLNNSRVLFMNEAGELIDSVLHYKEFEKKIYSQAEFEGSFFTYNGNKYLKEARYSDTVFRITKDMKLYPEYCISVGKYAYNYEDLIGNSEIIRLIKFVNVKFENDQFIAATGFSLKDLVDDPVKESGCYIFINKASSSAKKVRFYYSEETCRHFLKEKTYLNTSNFSNSPGMYFEPPEPKLLNDGSPIFRINNVSEDNTIWIGAEKALNIDDNPVIVLVHLKK